MRLNARQRAELGLGLGLLGLLLAWQGSGWRWPWLSGWQQDESYLQFSGFALAALLGHQWYLSVVRSRGEASRAARLVDAHTLAGVSAPVLFFLHAQRLGHAYLLALSVVFLAVFASGLLNLRALGQRVAWYQATRITLHVGLSTTLLALLGYHVFISYAYE